ncbi:hypothetical protein G9A89_004031 [Geosiphon pyriformis]|nr:hypothetical protein G9A89_004031 [Geosiphon pyriformis]
MGYSFFEQEIIPKNYKALETKVKSECLKQSFIGLPSEAAIEAMSVASQHYNLCSSHLGIASMYLNLTLQQYMQKHIDTRINMCYGLSTSKKKRNNNKWLNPHKISCDGKLTYYPKTNEWRFAWAYETQNSSPKSKQMALFHTINLQM